MPAKPRRLYGFYVVGPDGIRWKLMFKTESAAWSRALRMGHLGREAQDRLKATAKANGWQVKAGAWVAEAGNDAS